MIDIHAHVLPALDDGPAHMGDAIALAKAACQDNISTIVGTPHMCDGVYNASRADIFAAVGALNDALAEHGVPVSVLAGADIHVDTELPGYLRRGELVTVADRGKHLMIELPTDVVPGELDQLVFALQLQGVNVIVSHPERNRMIQEDPTVLIPMAQSGCLMQVTAASILGDFGSHAQESAKALFDCRLVHFVATDMHGLRRRTPKLSQAVPMVEELVGAELAHEILEENPEALIEGRYIDPPEPTPPPPRRKWFFW